VRFMVIEHFHPGQAPAVYRRYRDRGRLAPEGLTYVASWVDLEESEHALEDWMAAWRDLIDFEVIPVRTSEEAARAIAPEL
jgi:Domain of unknown function (DUF3303)